MNFNYLMPQIDGTERMGDLHVFAVQNDDKTVTIASVEFIPVVGASVWLPLALIHSNDCRELQQRIYGAAHNHLSGDNVLDITTDIQQEHIAQMKENGLS